MFKNASKLWHLIDNFSSRNVVKIIRNVTYWKCRMPPKPYPVARGFDTGGKGLTLVIGAGTLKFGKVENILIEKRDPMDVEMNSVLAKTRKLIEDGNLKAAEGILDQALQKTRRSGSVWSNIILLLLGKIALKQGEYVRSERFYMELLKSLGGMLEVSPAVERLRLWASIDLAQLFTETNDYKKAEEHYKYSLFTLEAMSVGAGEFHWAVETLYGVLDGYSELLTLSARYDEALTQREKAHAVCTSIYGERHIKVVRSFNELGRIYTYKGRDDDAISCFTKAIEMCRLLEGVDPMELAALLVNNGRVQLRRGLLSKAKENCEKAHKISGSSKNQLGLAHAAECLEAVKDAMK